MNDEADQVIKELFDSLIKKYRIGLEKSMRGRICRIKKQEMS